MKSMLMILSAIFGISISITVTAHYNANWEGKVTRLQVYDAPYIYIRLDNHPSHPSCNNEYFVIPESVSTETRQYLYSRLLAAYATGSSIYIGYDGQEGGTCAHGYLRVHSVFQS